MEFCYCNKTVPYDYILNYPKVVMYAKEEGMADLEGTISDNSMSVRNLDKDSYFDTFYYLCRKPIGL